MNRTLNLLMVVILTVLLFATDKHAIASDSKPTPTEKSTKETLEQSPEKVIASCILLAAKNHSIPPAILLGVYQISGGEVGKSYQENGLNLFGIMKIPEFYIEEAADIWKVSKDIATKWVKDDPCTNAGLSSWKIRNFYDNTGSLPAALISYGQHSGYDGKYYLDTLITKLTELGLIKGELSPQKNHRIEQKNFGWYLVITLDHGFTVERFVSDGLAMCGLKSKQIHYEMMIEDRFFSGNWYCKNIGTGRTITGKEWLSNKSHQDPFDNND